VSFHTFLLPSTTLDAVTGSALIYTADDDCHKLIVLRSILRNFVVMTVTKEDLWSTPTLDLQYIW